MDVTTTMFSNTVTLIPKPGSDALFSAAVILMELDEVKVFLLPGSTAGWRHFGKNFPTLTQTQKPQYKPKKTKSIPSYSQTSAGNTMYITTTDKLDPNSSITVASGPATQVEIDKVLRIWPTMSDSIKNLALLYRRQQAERNAKDTDFKRLW